MNLLPNILIVDDVKENLHLIEQILKKTKANLILAISGHEALEKARGLGLALAILDVRMPGMSGYELASKINEERSGDYVPILFLTAMQIHEKDIYQGYESGAIDYIIKPFNQKILLSKTETFLQLFIHKQAIIKDAELLKKSADELTIVNTTLRKSEEKYKTILNASPDGIFLTDLKGFITDVSEIGIELFGANRDIIIGKHFFRFIPAEEKITLSSILKKTMIEGISQNTEMKIRKLDRSDFMGEVSSTLIQGTDGKPFSYMIIIRDITQRKKMETMQIHSDRMASLGEMASGIAHEINQPLNTISLILDNIMYETNKNINLEKDYLKKKSDKIFENITRIRNIIDHIRSFSQKRDDYIMTGFEINSSIKNAVMMISEQYKHLSINLKLHLENNLPIIIGNTIKFEQVILNLLSNAKDALLEKKRKQAKDFYMFIEIRSFLNNQNLMIEIIDNGTGVSKEDIAHIMLPFYTTKDTGKGTGLGLSISYQIIKEMNGKIEILGNEFQGSTFQIVLTISNIA